MPRSLAPSFTPHPGGLLAGLLALLAIATPALARQDPAPVRAEVGRLLKQQTRSTPAR
jgi:hypothetical protein